MTFSHAPNYHSKQGNIMTINPSIEQAIKYHTTSSEKEFIDGLGGFAKDVSELNRKSRVTLLRNYIQSSEKRKDWGSIDKKAVIYYALKAYQECRGEAA